VTLGATQAAAGVPRLVPGGPAAFSSGTAGSLGEELGLGSGAVGVGVVDFVGLAVGVGVAVAVCDELGLGSGVGVAVGVGDGEALGVTFGGWANCSVG
jgi:hypothetical protein